MTVLLSIELRGESRDLEASDFPVSLGGTGAQVELDSAPEGISGYFGVAEERVFVQPAPGAALLCNGIALSSSRWLEPGDVIGIGGARLKCSREGSVLVARAESRAADTTEPPVLVAPPTEPPSGSLIRPADFRPADPGAGHRAGLPWGRLALLGTILAAAAVGGWLLFRVQSIEVVVEPLPDTLRFEGALFTPVLAGRHLLLPGTYTLVAEKEGFRPLSTEVTVSRHAPASVSFEMIELAGLLKVTSEPLPSARVYVDGAEIGVTPLDSFEIESGEHEVRVSAERHLDFVTIVRVEGRGQLLEVNATLAPNWGVVTIESEPAGAIVRLRGAELGTTPLSAEIEAGNHTLELTAAGYKPFQDRITVEAGETSNLPLVRLQPADGNLLVRSRPTGATVTVNGAFRGSTPLDVLLPPGSRHEIRLSKAGYASYSKTVELRPSASEVLDAELVAEVGRVEITSQPPNASVWIDGVERGTTGETLELPAAPVDLEIRKDGYPPFRTTITPRPGAPQAVHAVLETVEEVRQRETPEVITGPLGEEYRLVPGGRFSMGAPRREPGRRSNESLREVELTRPFYLAVREVANRDFRKFRSGHLSGAAETISLEPDHHPVVRVSWEDAAAYCNWLSQQEGLPLFYVPRGASFKAASPLNTGYRLPTESEWAWAARYPDGRTQHKYPWGGSLPVPAGAGNYGDASARGVLGSAVPDYNDRFPGTSPVDSFAPDARGFYNLDGNAAEWVHDLYWIPPSNTRTVERDPMGPAVGESHVIRGSSWMNDSVTELRLSYRDSDTQPRPDVGFRCARFAHPAGGEEQVQ